MALLSISNRSPPPTLVGFCLLASVGLAVGLA
jgi:hypothetical protein